VKNFILKNINYLYLFSLLVILIFYFFPGDIVSYFMRKNSYTDHDSTLNPIAHAVHFLINTGGYSINHILIFIYITAGGLLTYFKKKKFYMGIFFFIFLSIFLELIHLITPNRAFEFNDLLSNIAGVIIVFFSCKLKKKFT